MLQPKVKNLLNGKFVDSATSDWIPLVNPVSRRGVRSRPADNFVCDNRSSVY